jgi:hypothetical protein
VVVCHVGKKIRLPGRVWYVLPVGDFQISCAVGQLPVRPAAYSGPECLEQVVTPNRKSTLEAVADSAADALRTGLVCLTGRRFPDHCAVGKLEQALRVERLVTLTMRGDTSPKSPPN